jgi:hypothetical protein
MQTIPFGALIYARILLQPGSGQTWLTKVITINNKSYAKKHKLMR